MEAHRLFVDPNPAHLNVHTNCGEDCSILARTYLRSKTLPMASAGRACVSGSGGEDPYDEKSRGL